MENGLLDQREIDLIMKSNVFPVVVTCTECERKVLRRVHPLMQDNVRKIIQSEDISHLELYIFGSSITMKCNLYSDLDIAVKTVEFDTEAFFRLQSCIAKLVDVPCDVVYLNSVDESDLLYDEIIKGVRVGGNG